MEKGKCISKELNENENEDKRVMIVGRGLHDNEQLGR